VGAAAAVVVSEIAEQLPRSKVDLAKQEREASNFYVILWKHCKGLDPNANKEYFQLNGEFSEATDEFENRLDGAADKYFYRVFVFICLCLCSFLRLRRLWVAW
jgi:hypothetical protein